MKKKTLLLQAMMVVLLLLLCLCAVSCGECEHEWGEWSTTVAPTCEAGGTRTRTCTLCEETQTEELGALGHSFSEYSSNNDASCQKNETQTAVCAQCGARVTREIADTKDTTKHTSTDVRYQQNGEDGTKHDLIHVCCNAIIETTAHRWNDGAADPQNQGVTVYTCKDCGATKKESDSTHAHQAIRVEATSEGCTTFGNIEYWYCAGCDTCFADEALTQAVTKESVRIAPSHTGGTATCLAQAICSRCYLPYGSLDPQNHASTETAYVVNPTDAERHDKVYSCCQRVILTEDHAWNGGTVDGDVTVYECIHCHKTNRVPLPPHTHNAVKVDARSATCTAEGNIEHWYCEGCTSYFADEALTQPLTEQQVTIAPAHTSTEFTYAPNATNPDCHDKKHLCCGAFVETLLHEYQHTGSYAASCDTNGYSVYSCQCGKNYEIFTSPALGHDVDFWNLTEETAKSGVDCTYVQRYTGTCYVCGEEAEKTTEAVRHTYVATITAHATCMTTGTKRYQCACGATPTPATETIPVNPNAHAWDGGTVNNGVTTYTCQNGCHATKTAIVSSESTETVDKSVLEGNELVLGGISLKLDAALLGKLDADAVTVTANPVSDTDREDLIANLPESLRTQIAQNTPIFDFALMQNGADVLFDGGKIRITMPYELPANADADRVAIWYVNGSNELSFYEANYYEVGEQGYVTFEAEHFSIYLPGLAPANEACVLYGHLYESKITPPTCTERGYTEYHCQRCGESRIDDILYALGHAYDAGTGTAPTCTAVGQMRYTCTRTDCDHTLERTIPMAAHAWQYDSEQSVQVSCTTDALDVYTCRDCGQTKKVESYEAWGHLDLRPVSATLAPGATKCTEGLIVTYRCSNEDYNNNDRCTYTETKTLYEHLDLTQYKNEDEGQPEEGLIMLGDYLPDHFQYQEEPYIRYTKGCACGEKKGEVSLYGGMSMDGMQIFSFEGMYFNGNSFHYNEESLLDQVLIGVYTNGMPEQYGGVYVEYKIRIKENLLTEGCHKTYSLTVMLGYDEGTQEAEETLTFLLGEIDNHVSQKTATVSDPSKSCYSNCRDENGGWYSGISVVEVCKNCGDKLNSYMDGVSSSSQHYFVPKEVYEHDHIEGSNYYGVRIFINECPCGQVEYTIYRGDCQFNSQTVGDVTVYECSCGFRYAERAEEIEDVENCHYTYTEYLYIGCESTTVPTNCEQTVICPLRDETRHYHVTNTTTENDPAPTEDPCRYYSYYRNVCDQCEEVTYLAESYPMIHDPLTATSTDSHGNVTTTTTCRRDGCGYVSIEVKDPEGNTLRSYTDEKNYGNDERCVSLATYQLVGEEIRPTMERAEYYDLESGALKRWNQSTYTYEIDEDKGCICTQIFTNHEGEYVTDESNFCNFGNSVHQDKTCLTDGFELEICTLCGYKSYSYFEECNGHSPWEQWADMIDDEEYRTCKSYMYYRCNDCDALMKVYPNSVPDVVVKKTDESDGVYTLTYRNFFNSDATGIDATYQFVAYAFAMNQDTTCYDLLVNKETQTPICLTLTGVNVRDDGEGHLEISMQELADAIDAQISVTDDISYTTYLVITSTQGNVTYIPV